VPDQDRQESPTMTTIAPKPSQVRAGRAARALWIERRVAPLTLVVSVLVSLPACAPPAAAPEETVVAAAEAASYSDAAVRAAVASPDRSETDRADDAARRPGDVLAFFEIEPGMTVLDLLAGGGYHTEILSRVVGEQGRVLCHNNEPYIAFVGEALEERFAGGRLANVERIVADVNALALDPGSLDAVVFVLGYHDIYYAPEDGSWPAIDRDGLLARLYDGLRPGGVLGIVDHVAAAGSDPADTGNRIHRIDPALVRDQVEAVGFALEAESDVLRHPEDDHTTLVFDEVIRRKTDRFVFRFRKPIEG
jgi:predicted methyltransferase